MKLYSIQKAIINGLFSGISTTFLAYVLGYGSNNWNLLLNHSVGTGFMGSLITYITCCPDRKGIKKQLEERSKLAAAEDKIDLAVELLGVTHEL